MKKLIMFIAIATVIGVIAGCVSSSKHYNMTGSWKYTFEETGKSGVQTGSMTLVQVGYSLSGTSNDSYGEFLVNGVVAENSSTFTIDGKRNDLKRSYHLTGILTSDDKFEGSYTTDQNTSGTMKGSKIIAN